MATKDFSLHVALVVALASHGLAYRVPGSSYSSYAAPSYSAPTVSYVGKSPSYQSTYTQATTTKAYTTTRAYPTQPAYTTAAYAAPAYSTAYAAPQYTTAAYAPAYTTAGYSAPTTTQATYQSVAYTSPPKYIPDGAPSAPSSGPMPSAPAQRPMPSMPSAPSAPAQPGQPWQKSWQDWQQESSNGLKMAQQKQAAAPIAATSTNFSPYNWTANCQVPRQCSGADSTYRSYDGSCNNNQHASWGQAGLPYKRLTSPKPSVDCKNPTVQLPNPRVASLVGVDRNDADTSNNLSLMIMSFGQFVDHDLELTPPRWLGGSLTVTADCCADPSQPDCCSINAPSNDPFYTQGINRAMCMPFVRSILTMSSAENCANGWDWDVMNANTAFIDLSTIYGSDEPTAKGLRTMQGGLLRMSSSAQGRAYPELTSDTTMLSGDARYDVHPGLTVLVVAFTRNHNQIASGLQQAHPDWDDERLYQEARKINIAVVQNVIYQEFIPALLGSGNSLAQPAPYNPSVDATISMPFSTAAFRLHTYIPSFFIARDQNYAVSSQLHLRDIFHNLKITTNGNMYDDLIRGFAVQPTQAFNGIYSEEMTEWLFPQIFSGGNLPARIADFGADIVALNVQRGRDHKLQGYTTYVEFCGLGKVTSWSDLTQWMTADWVNRLQSIYSSPSDVDLYMGGIMETALPGSDLGPTFSCLVNEQFSRLRSGDRFFYTNPDQFTPAQLASIRSTTLARVLCDNADSKQSMALPLDVFHLPGTQNPITSCSNIPAFTLSAWM